MAIENLITDHLDLWTAAVRPKSSAGRGSNSKLELTGIKKLRELILELAVRGKLVPQDPSDEPASALLARIAAEKARLVKEGKIKKPKALPEISEEDKPFELPEGWEWSRINDVLHLENGDRSKNYPNKSALVEHGIPFVNAGQLSDGLVSKNELCFISKDRFDILNGGKFNDGDILFCLRGSLGKCAVVKNFGVGAIASSLVILRPYLPSITNYIMIVMNSPLTSRNISKYNNGTAQPNLSAADLSKFGLPLPPLVEQHRIVAKVDELMALCDQLEQRSESQLAAHQTLVETLLGSLLQPVAAAESSLTDSCDADELAQNWARLSTHFDTLFTTEASIDALKQTILQLAVMGRLVPFGSNTEKGDLKKFLSFGPRNGFSPKEVKSDTGVKVLKLGATSYGSLDLNESKSIDVEIERESNLWLNKGDILIQRGNSANYVGCNCLVEEDVPGVIYPDLMMKIRPSDIASSEYLSMWLSSPMAREFMWSRMTGTSGTMPKISKKVVESIPIVMPSRQTQDSIVAKAQDLLSICEHLKQRLRDIQQTQLQLTDTIVGQVV